MKKLPIGISDYKKLIEGDFYYVDKTLLVKELLDTTGEVLLITRPRRFGKTLNLSMLKYFFEHSEPKNDYLFYSTAIWQDQHYRRLQGTYPVISLTFKGVKASSWQHAYEQIKLIIAEEFKRHANYLLPYIPTYEQRDYKALLERTAGEADYNNSLLFLTKLLYSYYKQRVLIFIDEYDAPMHAAYANGYYQELVDFMRGLLTAALKDNTFLERSILTGILRTAKEGIFSGLNNLKVHTILHNAFADKFGFTPQEVEKLLEEYLLLEKSSAIKDWYNKYNCGAVALYNPWSLFGCIDNKGALNLYWANTSDNFLVKKLIARADETVKKKLEDLLDDATMQTEINSSLVLPTLEHNPTAVWSLLLFAGYLTYTHCELKEGKDICTLIIPNKEIKILYKHLINDILQQSLTATKIQAILEILSAGDSKKLTELLQEFVINSMSAFDISATEPEKSYHLFVLGLLVLLSDIYKIRSNRESGYGRYDIMLIPHNKQKAGIIIEFKKASPLKSELLDTIAEKALQQIIEKNYAQDLKDAGVSTIIAFGVAFQGKKVYARSAQI